jgi:hypothetical protein
MKHVRANVTADGREGEIHPMYGVMANADFVERGTALQWNFTGDALGILHYIEGDIDAYEAMLVDTPEVLGYELEPAGDDAFYAYIRDATTEPLRAMFEPITDGGLIVIPPIVYHGDGSVTLSLFGPDEELQSAMDAIPEPVSVDVEAVGGLSATAAAVESRLSERQRDALSAAVELGYYEVPREASHEAVAEQLDCAPSTAAEHLRKGESKVLQSIFG